MFLDHLRKNIIIYSTLTLIVLISTFVLWLPFLLKATSWIGLEIFNSSLLYVYGHFDGPLYIIAAKSFYDPQLIDVPGKFLVISLPLSPGYFAAHLPLYPLFIRLFALLFGFLKSMIFVNLSFTVLLVLVFYFILKNLKLSGSPLLLTIIFLFLPRFLVVRSVGAPESLFILLILLSLFFFEKKNYLLAGIFGGLSVMTKTPGVLLFLTYILVILERSGWIKNIRFDWRWFYLLVIPIGLFLVFGLYWKQYGDFFAYFKSGDNIHLVSPFAVFNFQKAWVGTAWLEDILFYFFLYLLTVFFLKDAKYRSFFYFSLIFFLATIFIQHRDIARYSLPLWPMALVAFERFFTSKKFIMAFLILLPAIYLYAWDFILYNVMPISDWQPFL